MLTCLLKGKYLIGNVDSQGGLLFESPSGSALVDFRRTGGHGNRTLVRAI
jgi:hypothetical protein